MQVKLSWYPLNANALWQPYCEDADERREVIFYGAGVPDECCSDHVQCKSVWLDFMEAANRPDWKKYSILKDSLIFLTVYLIKKLIENQLRMSFLPADMIFAQASSDAFEASTYVDSSHGLMPKADNTHFKPLQDVFENESLDWFSLYLSYRQLGNLDQFMGFPWLRQIWESLAWKLNFRLQ